MSTIYEYAEMTSITLDTRKARQYAAFLQTAPAIARQEMKTSMTEALLLLEREIKDDTPVGVGGGGGLRGSITHDLRGVTLDDLQGRVFSPLKYALPVEHGTKPHWVGREGMKSLQDWVERKLGVSPDESESVAYLVARKIARKGTKGAHMFENNLSEHARQVVGILGAAVERIIAQLSKGH